MPVEAHPLDPVTVLRNEARRLRDENAKMRGWLRQFTGPLTPAERKALKERVGLYLERWQG